MTEKNNSGQELEDALKRLKDHEARVRGLVQNVTVDVDDLRLVLQEIDDLRIRLERQIY